MSSVSIAIVGTGAIGCALAVALAECGHQPLLAARTSVARISRTLAGRTVEVHLPSAALAHAPGPVDWVCLCTKAYQTASASEWFASLVGPRTTLAVLQNGVDHAERLSAYLPTGQIMPVVVQMAAERTAPGTITQTRPGRLFVPDTSAGRGFAALLHRCAAIEVVPEPDFVSALWRKLTANATTGAFCALAVRKNEIFGAPMVREAASALMAEVMAVGRAEGAEFPAGFVEQTLDMLAGPVSEHWTSMAADRRDGHPMEWEVRNAVVGRLGRRHGIPTPLNDLVTALLSQAG